MGKLLAQMESWRNMYIRMAEHVIIDYLLYIYIRILKIEKHPAQFKKGLVISLFKGGKRDRFDTNNYRDITLTPVQSN